MRWKYLLLLLPQLLLSASEEYYGELFGTSDFALLTQQNCARFIESEVGKGIGQCPLGLSEAHNMDTFDHSCPNVDPETVRSHLVRDIHRKEKPRLLFVYANKRTRQINYGIDQLSLAGNYSQWSVPAALKETSVGYHIQPGETLADSVFDTQSNILYLIISSSNKSIRKLHMVYISNIFHGRTEFKEISRDFTLHTLTRDRFDWVENPYEHTVYYMKKNTSHSVVYKLPISELMKSLIDGTEGEIIFEVEDSSRILIWTHKGAMITVGRKDEGNGEMDSYYLRNSTASSQNSYNRGRRCMIYSQGTTRKTRRLITVFDWDYCILKYGGDGSKGPDSRKCPVYYDDVAVVDNAGSSNTIYIVVIVLLFMFAVLLLVYVCWLRRNLDEVLPRDEHKPVPYYPTGQPLDSTFDMSVDRWDQY